MHTALFGKGEADVLFADTGFEKRFTGAVHGSRLLSRLSSTVELPEKLELPTDRPVMFAANHSSLFDLVGALILLGNYGITSRIAVNSRFFANPAAGAFLRNIGCIPFSKQDRAQAEQATITALQQRQSAAIMPEGRITRPADQTNFVGPGRPGVSRIATAAGAAVVPIGFAFANEAWKPGTWLPKPRLGRHSVIARVGPPMLFESDDHLANAEALMESIGQLVGEGRSLALGQQNPT